MTIKQRVAFITGITGQDGYYLTRLLLQKNYIVHGLVRRSSSINTTRLDPFYQDIHEKDVHLYLHYGDMTDALGLCNLVENIKPDEVYNLAAMSHVKISFDIPDYCGEVDALGTLRLLEACRKFVPHVRFYQAGTSELYGGVYDKAQNENTPFNPRSPYAVAKLYSHWITRNFRESYNLHCSNGILFNHSSPHRGHNFVEQKIVRAAVAIKAGKQDCLYLGNIYSKRDIGHSDDYVRAMWLMLQQQQPDDYVIATGVTTTIKDIVNMVFEKLNIHLAWSGEDENEVAVDTTTQKIIVKIDPKYYRPCEVDNLLGDSTKARHVLGWKPKYNLDTILDEMIDYEKNK